jgi:hypothetical protein
LLNGPNLKLLSYALKICEGYPGCLAALAYLSLFQVLSLSLKYPCLDSVVVLRASEITLLVQTVLDPLRFVISLTFRFAALSLSPF